MRSPAPSPIPLLGALLLALPGNAAQGPGLGNLTYAPAEVFAPIAVLKSPGGHGNAAMVNGYLMTIYSADGGGTPDDGGIDFWDVSDPRRPLLHARYDDADTHGLREAHGFAFSSRHGADWMVAQAGRGIQFWDLTDPDAIALVRAMDLPGIEEGDYTGAWWVFWQAPWVFVAGVGQGLYVVDARDPAQPLLVAHLPTSALGNLNPATVYAVGNLLVLMQNQGAGYASVDVSDPARPFLIRAMAGGSPGYSHLFAAGRILSSGGNGGANTLAVHSVSADGASILYEGQGGTACGSVALANGGYGSYQDGFFFSGFSNRVTKFRVSDRALIGCGSSGIPGRDEDFGLVLGNLIWVGNDHGQGSALIPHQSAPDTTGPAVEQVEPPDGASGQALTSRVGLSLSDSADPESLGPATFAVQPLGGAPLPGVYSAQMGLVNFGPDQPLAPDTTYEVVVGGIRDLVGNPGPAFRSRFRTGAARPPDCSLGALAPVEVDAEAGLDAAVVSGSGPLRYSWDFGDGTPATPPAATSAARHVFLGPGRHGLTLTVTSSFGSGSCSATQIVHFPLSPRAPSASSSIVHDGLRSYSVNPDAGTVTAIDDATLSVAWEAPVGDDPRSLALAPDGELWVVNRGDASVSVLAAASGALRRTLALPRASQPWGIAFAPDASAAFVTLAASGRILALSPAGQVLGSAEVGPDPRGLAISGDSRRILVTRFRSPAAVLPDPADPASLRLPEGEVRELAPDLSLVRVFRLAFDPGPDSELAGRGVPNYLSSIRISPDGRRALVPSVKSNVARGLYLDGRPLDFESRTRTIVSQLDLQANAEDLAARIDFNDRALAQAVVTSPLGDLFFAALEGTNLVEVRETWTGRAVGALAAGRAPQGLALNPDASRLFVQDFLSRTVSVFDVSGLVDGSQNAGTLLARIPAVAHETLAPEVLLGKRIFYDAADPRMSRDGYLSCATCHLDGGSDGQVWDFTQGGEGLRNTIELRGRAGTGHGNLHWTANFDEVQDFENDIRDGFSGTGFLADADFAATRDPLGAPKAGRSADLDALAAYLASLDRFPASPWRAPDGQLTASGAQGLLVFHARGCAACHAGPAFSDGLRHDVGTRRASSGLGQGLPLGGVGFDTPTLLGLWETPPYLHDGQAATLEEVLDSRAHGGSDSLSPAERGQLADYLRQLENGDLPPAQVIGFLGTARGGRVQLRLAGVAVRVTTRPGETAAEAAAALAAAVAAEPRLRGVQATAVGAQLALSRPASAAAEDDAGLALAGAPPNPRVPALGPCGLAAAGLGLGAAVALRSSSRAKGARASAAIS